MDNRTFPVAAILAALCAAVLPGQLHAERGPSTPAERTKAVQLARQLETEPLGEGAGQARRWLTEWLVEIPDVSVAVCGSLLEPILGSKKKHAAELVSQMMFSSAAFVIESPDRGKDHFAMYLAGVEGSLRAYEAIIEDDPKARWEFLDGLLAKRDAGELESYVRAAMEYCAEPAGEGQAGNSAGEDTAGTKAKTFFEEAKDLWHRKEDYNAALAAFNEAVELAPDDPEIRMHRGSFFEVVSALVVDQDKARFKELAREDYKFVAAARPESVAAGVVRDGLARLDGRDLFPEQPVNCPGDAERAYDGAETLFRSGRFEESLKFFGVATTACPESARMWISHADAYYMLKEYDKARELFLRALEASPWNRKAHRFLSDTENRLGNNAAALRQAALAVLSDPTYEAAWASLRSVAGVLDRGWQRVYGEKTEVRRESGESEGKTRVTVTIATPDDGNATANTDVALEVAPPDEGGDADPDLVLWAGYGVTKAAILTGTIVETDETGEPVARDIDPSDLSSFEIEERTVTSTLSMMEELAAAEPASRGWAPGPFWSMIDRAARAGFLQEAIFLHMMDEDLVGEYAVFRDKNSERLVQYLETLIAPVPKDDVGETAHDGA